MSASGWEFIGREYSVSDLMTAISVLVVVRKGESEAADGLLLGSALNVSLESPFAMSFSSVPKS